jgi:hypothetical protein
VAHNPPTVLLTITPSFGAFASPFNNTMFVIACCRSKPLHTGSEAILIPEHVVVRFYTIDAVTNTNNAPKKRSVTLVVFYSNKHLGLKDVPYCLSRCHTC